MDYTSRNEILKVYTKIAFVYAVIPIIGLGIFIPPDSWLMWLLIPAAVIIFLLVFSFLAICCVGSIHDHD